MTKVTWVGEGESDPKQIEWGGYTFKKGEAVDVEDESPILTKAKGNKHFKVEGGSKDVNPVQAAPKFPKI